MHTADATNANSRVGQNAVYQLGHTLDRLFDLMDGAMTIFVEIGRLSSGQVVNHPTRTGERRTEIVRSDASEIGEVLI